MTDKIIPNMMNTIRFHMKGGPDVLRYEQVATPTPGPGEVLAKLKAIGVNYADVMRRGGDSYPMPSPLPFTLGGEGVATIVSTGAGADPGLIGRRVIVFPGVGCYSDYVAVPGNRIYDMPDTLDDAQAIALFVQGLTAAFILKFAGRLAGGETVLVQGAAGGVGTLAVQLAKLYGAGSVIGAASTAEKRDLVLSLGADLAVDYGRPGWGEEVRSFTNGRGVDLVLEMSGGQIASECFSMLAPFGRSVVYGHSSDEPWLVDTQKLPPRNLTVSGFFFRPYLDRGNLVSETLREFAEYVRLNRLKVQLGGKYRLSNASAAHTALESRQTTGKLVLVPDAEWT